MDWASIGVGIVGVAFGIFQGLKALASDQKQQREENEKQRHELQHKLRRAFLFGDVLDAWISEQRMQLRRHNRDEHPTGENRVVVSELPEEIENGIRAYVEEER